MRVNLRRPAPSDNTVFKHRAFVLGPSFEELFAVDKPDFVDVVLNTAQDKNLGDFNMWDEIAVPWQNCFEEAWESYCNGSIPIGAVLVNNSGEIVSRGRNRINEAFAPGKQTYSNRLAHAEINVLLQVEIIESQKFKDFVLYTTTEPCILCFGAIVMTGIRKVRYAANDPISGGANLNLSENVFIKARNIDIQCDQKFLGNIQRVLRADHVLRNFSLKEAERFLNHYRIEYPEAIELGKQWFVENKLSRAIEDGKHISEIVNDICKELKV